MAVPTLRSEVESVTQRDMNSPRRQYPKLYEKLVPIALVLVSILILVILSIVILVLLGLFPGT